MRNRNVANGPDPDDPTVIDWPARQAAALLPFKVIDGRPINPHAPTGVERGRGGWDRWGENPCADAVLLADDTRGHRWLAMVERRDGHGWALPGGGIEAGEDPVAAAIRELGEETGFDGSDYDWEQMLARYVPDPRATDEAWPVTVPSRLHIGRFYPGFFPALEGADDAVRAEWIPAGSYAELVYHVRSVYGGKVFDAHDDLLRDLLNHAPQPKKDTA